jgi:hypothetical protein
MATTNIKDEARKIIEKMPDDSTWDDLMHKVYVRQAIESCATARVASSSLYVRKMLSGLRSR